MCEQQQPAWRVSGLHCAVDKILVTYNPPAEVQDLTPTKLMMPPALVP